MKKRTKIILVVVGVVFGLLILVSVAYLLLFQSQTGKMTPLETRQINEDVYVIRDSYVNMFLVKWNDLYIVIDGGVKPDHILQGLDELNIKKEEVVAVFLTHTDTDHVGALSLFENAVIYISEAEKQMIDGRTPRFWFVHNRIAYEPEVLADGEMIDLSGLTVKGILTPGHTPGAMCYLIDGKYLFVGDSMSLKEGKVDLFNDFFNMDSKTQGETLKKLADLSGVEYIFTAHYGATDDFAGAFSAWRE